MGLESGNNVRGRQNAPRITLTDKCDRLRGVADRCHPTPRELGDAIYSQSCRVVGNTYGAHFRMDGYARGGETIYSNSIVRASGHPHSDPDVLRPEHFARSGPTQSEDVPVGIGGRIERGALG